MQTYLLQRNLKVTDSEIMGLLVHNADSVRKMTHSGRDCASQLPHNRPALKGLLNMFIIWLPVISNGIWIGVLLYIFLIRPEILLFSGKTIQICQINCLYCFKYIIVFYLYIISVFIIAFHFYMNSSYEHIIVHQSFNLYYLSCPQDLVSVAKMIFQKLQSE